MKKNVIIAIMALVLAAMNVAAQDKSRLQQRAETETAAGNSAAARSLWLQAYEDYVAKGRTGQGVDCGVQAAALYHADSHYQEAFDLLRAIDHVIAADKDKSSAVIAAWRYKVTKERMAMYVKMHRAAPAAEQLAIMERHANAAADEHLLSDLLYHKAIFYYTFGQDAKGNAIFSQMATRLTAAKEYDKVDEVYRTLIASGRKSGNASMVAQAYSGYIAWKDSTAAVRKADAERHFQEEVAARDAQIAEKDDALAARQRVVGGLLTLAAVLAVALVLTALVLVWFVVATRKQKKAIRRANENIALKAHFIGNISKMLRPTLDKLDAAQPEVKALQDFAAHVEMLSQLEAAPAAVAEIEDTPLLPFCKGIVEQMRGSVRRDVSVKTDVPDMNARINREYVAHILGHLLANAAAYTPEGGVIRLDYKKRGPHKQQFVVANTGSFIEAERRDDVFKPFANTGDIADGDGLGLPICQLMAARMNGNITIDGEYAKGTRFVLDLQL